MKLPRGLTQGSFNQLVAIEDIAQRIYTVRGTKVMLDRDLAGRYEVETKVLKRNVRRNIARFPQDFMLELTPDEFQNLRSQINTSSWGGTRYVPMAFTEYGVAMLSVKNMGSPLNYQVFDSSDVYQY